MDALSDEQRALALAYMKFAERGAAKYRRRLRYYPWMDADDLTGAAYLGLCVGALKFDPTRGVSFTTYGFQWIDQHLKRAFMKENRQNGWGRQHSKAERDAGAKGMKQYMRRGPWPTMNTEDGEPIELTAPEPSRSLHEQIEIRQKRALALMSTVDMREATILSMRLDGHSREVVGKHFGITRERVRQIEKRIIKRAREFVAARMMKEVERQPVDVAGSLNAEARAEE